MTVVDVHTHMLTLDWIELLKTKGGGIYDVKPTRAGQNSIWKDGAPFMTLFPGMWDYDLRIKAMDKARSTSRSSRSPARTASSAPRGEPEGRADRQRLDGRAAARAARPHPLVRLDAVAICRRRQGRTRARRQGRRGRRDAARQCGRRGTDRRKVRAGLGRDRPARPAGADPPGHAAGHGGHEHRRVRHGAADRLHDRHHARVHAHDLVGLPRQISEPEADRRAWRRDACRISPAGSTAATR